MTNDEIVLRDSVAAMREYIDDVVHAGHLRIQIREEGRHWIPVASLADARARFRDFIRREDRMMHQVRDALLFEEGANPMGAPTPLARISYNGKVWVEGVCLYNPYAKEPT